MTRLAILLTGAVLWPAAFSPVAAVQPSASTPVTIPFELATRHIMVKVTINGSRPLPFVLDTGANVALVRSSTAKELGLSLYGSVNTGGAGAGTQAGQRVKDARWSLVGLERFSQPVSLALPLPALPSGLGQEVHGIIGGEFIAQFVVELDYQARLMTLHDRRSFKYAGKGQVLPLELNDDNHAVVTGAVTPVGGKPIRHKFHLDIGAGGALVLHSPFVREHNLLATTRPTIRAIGMGGAGGQSFGRTGRVAALQLGPFTINNPITVFSQDQAGAFANRELAGNIGAQIASRFKTILDYGRRQIILEPSSTFADPFVGAMSGLAVRAEGDDFRTFRVRDVLEDSPASEAGLKVDDVITAIDGVGTESLTLSALLETLAKPVTYELTIRRGDEVVKVKLTPKPLV